MSALTVTNSVYSGLVERVSIPAELHARADRAPYASSGDAVPIHCCTPQQVLERAPTTHHYCGLFTSQLLAPLGELVYVRLDEHHAEKVFINRSKRILVTSADGVLAQWRSAPTFESTNHYVAGAPIVNAQGALVSLVTARRGNHYAVSTFEGDGGYFETSQPWKLTSPPAGHSIYGERSFSTREALRAHIASLGAPSGGAWAPTAVLHRGPSPRVVLVADSGRQVAHLYLHGVHTTDVEYL